MRIFITYITLYKPNISLETICTIIIIIIAIATSHCNIPD